MLNLGGVSALGFLATQVEGLPPALAGWLIGALCLVCLAWLLSSGYFSSLLAIKYDIIYQRERDLSCDAMQREWAEVSRKGVLRWFGLERSMPVLFIVGCLVFWVHLITPQGFQHGVAGFEQTLAALKAPFGLDPASMEWSQPVASQARTELLEPALLGCGGGLSPQVSLAKYVLTATSSR